MWWLILAGPSDLGHLCLTMATPSSLHITLGTQTQRRPAHSRGEWLETERWRWSQSCWQRSTAARSCLPRASPWWQYIYTISTQYLHNIYTISTQHLHSIYTIFTQYLHSIYTISTQHLHSIYIVSTQYLHSIYKVSTQYLHSMYTISTQYLHSIYTVLHSIYTVSTQYLHSIYTISTQYLHTWSLWRLSCLCLSPQSFRQSPPVPGSGLTVVRVLAILNY